MMFFLKKLISPFFFPLSVCAMLLIAGLFLLRRPGRERLGRRLLIVGVILFLLLGYPRITGRWLAPLERAWPPATEVTARGQAEGPTWICVLGRGLSAGEARPASSRIDAEGLQRIVEAVRLRREHPGAQLMISVPGDRTSDADKRRFVDDLMRTLGLPGEPVTIVGDARDTAEEVERFGKLARTNRVFLVSNAYHMRRAMLIARYAGLDAIAAPCGYYIDDGPARLTLSLGALFPNADGFVLSELSVYERLGWWWERMRGRRKSNLKPESESNH